MITKKDIIKHLTSNKKYYYYFIGFVFILAIIIGITISTSLPKNTKRKTIPNSIKSIDAHRISPCPDNWNSDIAGNCYNIHGLGSCTNDKGTKIKKFNVNNYLNAYDPSIQNNLFNLKKKCKWAKSCNLTWDIVDSLC
tara:strand:+ start:111 stop:524 length:414 start_codon:yes stop_codon:yes gene_type:complete